MFILGYIFFKVELPFNMEPRLKLYMEHSEMYSLY